MEEDRDVPDCLWYFSDDGSVDLQTSFSCESMCLSSANSAIDEDDASDIRASSPIRGTPLTSPMVTFAEESFHQVIEISTSFEDSNGIQRPRHPSWNPFARRPSNPSPKRRRFSVLSHPRKSPYLPADISLPVFSCGQPTTKPNLYEGFSTISEQDMRRLKSNIYLSGPNGKIPIIYDPLRKMIPPDALPSSW